MGIDFSHGKAHWSYSGFMRFRARLAETLGYVDSLSHMYNDGTYTCMKNEAIYPLIDHSDCDGNLTVEEMQQIIPQLEDIINSWPADDGEKSRGKFLVESMKEAISENEPLEFM